MKDTDAPAPPESPADDVLDDSFKMESASAPGAFDPPPTDTTAGGERSESVGNDQVEAPAPVEEKPAAEAKTPAGQAPADGDEPPAAKTKRRRGSVEDRERTLTKNIDTLTYRRRELEREIADLEKKKGPPVAETPTTPDEKPAPAAKAAPRPKHPNAADFDDDDAYTAAVAKWETDVEAWQTARDEALVSRVKGEITTGLETRQRDDAARAAEEQASRAYATRLQATVAKHADWNEKVATLKDLQSSWYDPEKHAALKSQTPFLSHIVKAHEEGPELLYWMGGLDEDTQQVLADLLPSAALRDALLTASSVQPLFEYFATDEGAEEFAAIAQMHPVRAISAVGALSARLSGASASGPPAARHSVTAATPPAKPPGGRGTGAPPATKGTQTFDEWMAEEDAKEAAAKKAQSA